MAKYVTLLWLFFSPVYICAAPIKYIDNTDSVDKHGVYFISLLKLALEKSKSQYGDFETQGVPVTMQQHRLFKSIDSGLIDLMWTVTSTQREQEALAIRIPLLKGLIGHRVFVIKKDREPEFKQISSLVQLSVLSAIQSHDWPDVAILENAGLKVEKFNSHSSMYKLLANNNVDYFPRSLLEVVEEMERNADDTLMINPHHMLVYPSAIYFFVSKKNAALAQRIEYGLNAAIKDGSFDQHFYSYSGHAKALKGLTLRNRTVFRIDNPLMPESTPVQNKSLWLDIERIPD